MDISSIVKESKAVQSSGFVKTAENDTRLLRGFTRFSDLHFDM
jgi:hypothetical protein